MGLKISFLTSWNVFKFNKIDNEIMSISVVALSLLLMLDTGLSTAGVNNVWWNSETILWQYLCTGFI